MKSDITRVTHRPGKHYRKVVHQQGRVQMDADWNEQMDILAHREETTIGDVVGLCGAPYHPPEQNANFKITVSRAGFTIAAGRIYVDGILCENEEDLNVSEQPSLAPPDARLITIPHGEHRPLADVEPGATYLAYIVVREGHVTALEDPHIADPALGGPDTATRTQTLWQVKLLRVGARGAPVDCLNPPGWSALVDPKRGRLSAQARKGDTTEGPCEAPSGGGYRRLQNQLYRVEIHEGGILGEATFKWSRDNGTVVTSLTAIDNDRLIVGGLGRDEALGFAADQWVELTDDRQEQQGRPGTLVKLKRVDLEEHEGRVVPTLTVADGTVLPDASWLESSTNPKVRRWDMKDGAVKVEQPETNEGWIELEDGVEIKFELEEGGGTYATGDYWLIPARTVTREIEWPKEGDEPQPQEPHGPRYHYCRLALLEANGRGVFSAVSDCRPLFPAVTELTSLFYVGGDGQEVSPHRAEEDGLVPLDNELVVGVANGRWPVQGARVCFIVVGGNGGLVNVGEGGVVITGPDGLASCGWRLDRTTLSQQVKATLLDAPGNSVHMPIHFTAHLSRATDVAFGPSRCAERLGATTVQDAIDRLCEVCGEEAPREAVRIREVFIGARENERRALSNDSRVEPRLLAGGLEIAYEGEIIQDLFKERRPGCSVTLELPFPLWGPDLEFFEPPGIGFQPLILDGRTGVTPRAHRISWEPTDSARRWLLEHSRRLFDQMRELELRDGEVLLAHLTLRGDYTYDDPACVRGGDFRMWFWLTPG